MTGWNWLAQQTDDRAVNQFRDVFMRKINMALRTTHKFLNPLLFTCGRLLSLRDQHTSSQILFYSHLKKKKLHSVCMVP